MLATTFTVDTEAIASTVGNAVLIVGACILFGALVSAVIGFFYGNN